MDFCLFIFFKKKAYQNILFSFFKKCIKILIILFIQFSLQTLLPKNRSFDLFDKWFAIDFRHLFDCNGLQHVWSASDGLFSNISNHAHQLSLLFVLCVRALHWNVHLSGSSSSIRPVACHRSLRSAQRLPQYNCLSCCRRMCSKRISKWSRFTTSWVHWFQFFFFFFVFCFCFVFILFLFLFYFVLFWFRICFDLVLFWLFC